MPEVQKKILKIRIPITNHECDEPASPRIHRIERTTSHESALSDLEKQDPHTFTRANSAPIRLTSN
jgi:hypothetical protein